MNTLFRRSLTITALCAAALGVAPASQPTSQPSAPAAPAQRPPSLERTMKTMNRPLRQIVKQIDDPSQDQQTLALIDDLQLGVLQAKSLWPDDVRDATGDARIKADNAYRTRMIALLRTTITLEESLRNGDRAAAKTAIASLDQQRKDGHDAYDVREH